MLLNIVYPQNGISKEEMIDSEDVNKDLLIGKSGLNSIMTYSTTTNPPSRFNFQYRPWVTEQYGRIFSSENLENYSAKIKNIGDIVMQSTGIILIYSQYIDGGLVPMALALEELGFIRNDKKSLFTTPPSRLSLDVNFLTTASLSGDNVLSPVIIV